VPDGSFSYVPAAGFDGLDNFGYTVTDTEGDSASGTATVEVDQPPAFVQDSPPLTATAGQPYGYTFAVTGAPTPIVSLAPGSPPWLSADPVTGALTGTPPVGTTSFSYAVTAASILGTATAGPFTVAVSPPPRKADLRATLSCPGTLAVGGGGDCVLTVANAGPDTARTVTAGISLTGQLAETGCTGCIRSHRVFTWRLATLAPGGSVSFTLGVQGARPGQAAVTATASASNPDPRPANNFATAAVTITKESK
jgi:hypothetical protein